MFRVGKRYSRKDIYNLLNVPDDKRKGSWNTGYRQYEGEIFIFANIDVPGKTGHDYKNYFKDGYFLARKK